MERRDRSYQAGRKDRRKPSKWELVFKWHFYRRGGREVGQDGRRREEDT